MEVFLGILIGLVFVLILFKPDKEVKKNDRDNAFSEKHFHKEMVSKFREEEPEAVEEIKQNFTVKDTTSYIHEQIRAVHPEYTKQKQAIDLYELRKEVERYGIIDQRDGNLIRVTPDNYENIKYLIEIKKMRR